LRLLGIEPEETGFDRRGFPLESGARRRLEEVGRTFVRGYRAALDDDDPDTLAAALTPVDAELSGFAYEGAAMGVALRDALAPWRTARLRALLAGPGRPHRFMVHVGAGWAMARLRRRPGAIRSLDPLLRWLALDGYGFHQGYFHAARFLTRATRPPGFSGYAARAFDQGFGRSLWFVEAAQPDRIRSTIDAFEDSRRADLWSGLALAASYAGGAGTQTLELISAAARGYGDHVAQGAAFAAAAREHAGNPAAHTDLACQVLTGLSSRQAAVLTDAAARSLKGDESEPPYEEWRRRLRASLAEAARGPSPARRPQP
jgi:hypothetical protein